MVFAIVGGTRDSLPMWRLEQRNKELALKQAYSE